MDKVKIAGIIPARYGSTRFPGKSLADIMGKTMIQRVFEQASNSKLLSTVVVATDHQKIYDHVIAFGGKVCMTDPSHQSGTDRCAEALSKLTEDYDYIINIQGDEPLIDPDQIDSLALCLHEKTSIATLAKKIEDLENIKNPNVVKVVFDKNNQAMYFSRHAIPFTRSETKSSIEYYQHIGIYAYRSTVLREITKLAASKLEKAESLEQLRWLENGYIIDIALTNHETIGVDSPEDLKEVLKRIESE